MAQQYLTFGGQDHLDTGMGENRTVCGKDVPYEATFDYVERTAPTDPCPKCFPETKSRKATAKAK